MQQKISRILFDCERMKYPYSGLYYYCMHLGKALLDELNPEKESIDYYIKDGNNKIFGTDVSYVRQRSFHKFMMIMKQLENLRTKLLSQSIAK